MMRQSIACINMIKQQLRTNNINDEEILNFYKNYPREDFIPVSYKNFAYSDMHIPLDNKHVILTPLEEAKILQSGDFNAEQVVVLTSAANVYLIALLSKFCKQVVIVDLCANQIVTAKNILAKFKIHNVDFLLQQDFELESLTDKYDAIICPAALEQVPANWLGLLKPVGKIFVAIGETTQNAQWLIVNDSKITGHKFVFSTHLPPLIATNIKSKFVF